MTYQGHADALRESAGALEDAQRALNHLEGIIAGWDESTNEERREAVEAARDRLDGTWSQSDRRSMYA